MGPRLCSRGNVRVKVAMAGNEVLQWGRGFVAAEIAACGDLGPPPACFNGAAAL